MRKWILMEKWRIELKCTSSESPWGNRKCEKLVDLLKETKEIRKGIEKRVWVSMGNNS